MDVQFLIDTKLEEISEKVHSSWMNENKDSILLQSVLNCHNQQTI